MHESRGEAAAPPARRRGLDLAPHALARAAREWRVRAARARLTPSPEPMSDPTIFAEAINGSDRNDGQLPAAAPSPWRVCPTEHGLATLDPVCQRRLPPHRDARGPPRRRLRALDELAAEGAGLPTTSPRHEKHAAQSLWRRSLRTRWRASRFAEVKR